MSAPYHPAAEPPARPIRWVGTQGFLVECASLEDVRDTTRATTGCGGCAPTVRQLLASRPTLEGARP